MLGVIWLLGMLRVFGYVLNPYSVLVPFLVFAIGLSHGAQKMNGIMQDVGRGTHRYVAARYTFRRLFVAGLTALLTNAFAFAVMLLIDIPAIRDLAITTSIGVVILIFTKLILIPVALSYIGVGEKAAKRSLEIGSATGEKGLRAMGLGEDRPLFRAPLRHTARRREYRARDRLLRDKPCVSADRRPRRRRAGTSARFALQP